MKQRAAVTALMLAAGCATTQPEVGIEAPGRPAVTWHSESEGTPPPRPNADVDTERQLLAELDAAEKKGTDQLAVADTLYNLAILRRQQGSLAESERLYRRALDIRERKQGPNHPEIAVILNNLAALEVAEGRYADAKPLLERALAIRQGALGADLLTAESLNNLALLFAARGDTGAAEPLYQQALAILEPVPAPAKGSTTVVQDSAPLAETHRRELERVLVNYAALLRDTGRDNEAEEVESRARALRGNGLGK